jgi:Amt family ammonium transporter
MLGKRKDTGPAHNMVLTMIGASLLWVGWFGFNAGSAVTAGLQAGMAMLVTHTATATAGFTWMIVEWVLRGKPTVIGICSGAVAGLVAITPASGFVGPMGSFWIGIAAGVVCYWGCNGLKHMFAYDDALDAFGVHAVGGATGALLTGVFAVTEYGGNPGLLEGNAMQVVYQAIGVGIVFIYDVIVTLIILKVVDIFIGLRVQGHSQETSSLIEQRLLAIPAVVACYLISGNDDFLVEAAVADLAGYEQLLLGQILAIPAVVEAHSTFAIRTILSGGPVPLQHWR